MKKLFVLFVLFLSPILLAQDFENSDMFSKFYFSILGGTNFNTIPTAGTAINIEVKTNVTSSINATLSIGYSVLYDDNPYNVKFYRLEDFDSKYHTHLLAVDRVRYSIIPINIGAEYTFLKSTVSPFAIIEAGYNYSSSITEGRDNDGIAGIYNTVNEIPADYRGIPPTLGDGSSFTLGVGLGVKYMLTERMDLNIRYIYHYNEAIINNNQVLIGFTF
jgi:opacity protein-like surface antigen